MVNYSVITLKDQEMTYDIVTIRYLAFGRKRMQIEKIVNEVYQIYKNFWNEGHMYDSYLAYSLENGRNELVKRHFKKLRRNCTDWSLDTLIKLMNTIHPGYYVRLLDTDNINLYY